MMERQRMGEAQENWRQGSPQFAELTGRRPDSTLDEIEDALSALQAAKEAWARLAIPERLALVDQVREGMLAVADRWVHDALAVKEAPAESLAEAEEWVSLAMVFRALRTIQHSLEEIYHHGKPCVPGLIGAHEDGRVVARVFPRSVADRALFWRFTGDLWMEPGVDLQETLGRQAAIYRGDAPQGKIAFVLGAGNASFLPVTDMLHKLFVEGQVVILKLNPVNAYIGPLIEKAFAALIECGFLRLVYGAATVGAHLCTHDAVDELHLTGSDKTYESIVFGPGPAGQARKAAGHPLNSRPFTGELGNVSPVIIVPGPWNRKDITEQATQIASWIVVNAGFACLAPRVIIQHKSWPQRHTLLEAIGDVLQKTATRKAYYPGAAERHAEFVANHPEAHQYGQAAHGHLPWTLIADVDPAHRDDICFKREAFCGLLCETALEAADVSSFIDQAVQFANETLWGTLCATLIVHPHALQDARIAAAVERAIANLRYGTVSVNAFAFYTAYFMTTPWGGMPGQDITDIQSGTGKTFNFLMFEGMEKSVTRAPFKRIDPLTVTSRYPHRFARRLAHFEYNPTWQQVPGLLWTALRS